MAEKKVNPEYIALQELERRAAAGDPAITPEIRAKLSAKLATFRSQEADAAIREAAASKEGQVYGETRAKARIDLPKVEEQGKRLVGQVEGLINHPGFESSVGLKWPIYGNGIVPGTDPADFRALFDQVKGQQFLQAFEMLKGGGQITEIEGKKATDAISRMSTSQSEAAFKEAAQEFIDTINGAIERTRANANTDFTGALGPNSAAPPAPADEGGLGVPGAPPPAPHAPAAPDGPSPVPEGPAPLARDQLAISDGSSRTEIDSSLEPVRQGVASMVASGASGDDIRAFLRQNGVDPSTVTGIDQAVAFRATPAGQNYKGGYTVDIGRRDIPLSGVERAAHTVAASPVGAFAVGAADAGTFGLTPKINAGIQALTGRIGGDNRPVGDLYDAALSGNKFKISALQSERPVSSLLGQTAGFIGGDAAIAAIPGVARLAAKAPSAVRPVLGDALYGGAYSAGSSDSLSDLPQNVLTGAGLAAGGGVLGRKALQGVAALASPVANASVRRLSDAGVSMTPGQILGASDGLFGRSVKGIEDRAAGFPIIGDMINSGRRRGVEDFNRVAINDALKPLGVTLPENVPVGHEGVAKARQAVSDAYDDALSRMRAVPDAQVATDLRAAARKANTLSQSHRDQFENILDTDLQPYLSTGKPLGGSDLQAIKQGLDGRIANLRGNGASPQDRDLAARLSDVRDAILDLAGRTDPDAAGAFARANEAHSMLARVEAAAAKSKDGVFSPNQFRQAVTKRGYGTTTAKVARGGAKMQQLATDASTVLPSAVPDSGTAGRAALGLAAARLTPGAALGGSVGYSQSGSEGALGGAALGAALFSRPSMVVTQKFLAGSRGKTINTLGDYVRSNAALGGAAGVPLLLHEGAK